MRPRAPCPRLCRLSDLFAGWKLDFFTFVIDHEIPLAHERPLLADCVEEVVE
jgi:hypothetical protein